MSASVPTAQTRQPKVSAEAIALIREMATMNRLWGAERICGELRRLDIRVATWTVQKYIRAARPPRRTGQAWATFLRNHASAIWACAFLPVTDVLFPVHLRRDRARVAPGGACGRDPPTDRRVGSPAIARGNSA